MTRADRQETIRRIQSLLDYERGLRTGAHPSQGQMVVTGPLWGAEWSVEKRIGYCVQVRKLRGQYWSDMVFLRHPDGVLTTHENQCYYAMTPEQQALARPLFEQLPEEEDYSEGYQCYNKVREIGFLIEDSILLPIENTSFNLVYVEADGTRTLTTHV